MRLRIRLDVGKFWLAIILLLPMIPEKALSISIQDLIEGNESISVGDKVFSGFFITPEDRDIDVTGVVVNDEPGLHFSINLSRSADQSLLESFSYFVDATDPQQITGWSLTADPTASTPDDRAVVLGNVSDVTPPITPPLADELRVSSLGPTFSFDTVTFEAQPRVQVFTEYGLNPNGGTASIGFITQTFSQAIIPEPATVSLFGIGLVILAIAGCQRSRSTRRGSETQL